MRVSKNISSSFLLCSSLLQVYIECLTDDGKVVYSNAVYTLTIFLNSRSTYSSIVHLMYSRVNSINHVTSSCLHGGNFLDPGMGLQWL